MTLLTNLTKALIPIFFITLLSACLPEQIIEDTPLDKTPYVKIISPSSGAQPLNTNNMLQVEIEGFKISNCVVKTLDEETTTIQLYENNNVMLGVTQVSFTSALDINVECTNTLNNKKIIDSVSVDVHKVNFLTTDLEVSNSLLGFAIDNDNVYDPPSGELANHKGDLFGFSVAMIGDIDGDGIENIAVGSPGYNNTKGRVFILESDNLSGLSSLYALPYSYFEGTQTQAFNCKNWSPCPEVIQYYTLPYFDIGLTAPAERLGLEIKGGGDINGDGYDDLIVASPYGSATMPHSRGTVYVVFGGPDFDPELNLTTLESNDSTAGFAIFGAIAQTAYNYSKKIQPSFAGYKVLGDLDVNGDGLRDIVVSAPSEDPNGNIYIVFGKQDDSNVNLKDLRNAGSEKGYIITTPNLHMATRGRNGTVIDKVGDINNDGLDDISFNAGTTYPAKNFASYIVYGKKDDSPLDIEATKQGDGYLAISGTIAGDFHDPGGFDVNGDGRSDMVVSWRETDANNILEDAYFVAFGQDNPEHNFNITNLMKTDNPDDGFMIRSDKLAYNQSLGAIDNVQLVDDINGDGLADIAINAGRQWGKGEEENAGGIWIVYGKQDAATVDLNDISAGKGGFVVRNVNQLNGFAEALDSSRDINGDGLIDLVFGLWRSRDTSINNGRIWGFYGGDHSLSIDFQGGDEDDTYTGTKKNLSLVGGKGNDTLISAGGVAVLYGGDGDDQLTVTDNTFRRIKGGNGVDTLIINTAETVNLTEKVTRLSSIEKIQLSGGELLISSLAMAKLKAHHNTVFIDGNGSVTVVDTGWVLSDSENGYTSYRNGHFTLHIKDSVEANTAPLIQATTMTVVENAEAMDSLGIIDVVEYQSEGLTFDIIDTLPSNAFTVDAAGDILVTGDVDFDFEAPHDALYFDIKVTDSSGLEAIARIDVQITDENEAPVLQLPEQVSVSESAPVGYQVTVASAEDQDSAESFQFQIIAGNADNAFLIDPDSGLISLQTLGALDFETESSRNITVEVTDLGGLTDSALLTVQVLNVDTAVRVFDVTFNSGDRNMWSNGDTFNFPALTDAIDFNLPSKDNSRLGLSALGYVTMDIGGEGNIASTFTANGGFVNATIPATITLNIPDEVSPGETIDIATELELGTPQMRGETMSMTLGSIITFDSGVIAAGWESPLSDGDLFDYDLTGLTIDGEHEVEAQPFTATWDAASQRLVADIGAELGSLAGFEYPWNSYLGMALSQLGLPSEQGAQPFMLGSYQALLNYTWIYVTLLGSIDVEQVIELSINHVKAKMIFDDGTEIAFNAGETVQYTVPANSDGKVGIALELWLDTTYNNDSEFDVTVGKRIEALDITTFVYGVPCEPSDACFDIQNNGTKNIQVGTNGPKFTITPQMTLPAAQPDAGPYNLSGFETKQFNTIIDLR